MIKYINEYLSELNKQETKDELKGVIRFISSLTCVDGLVVLDYNLTVHGFGAIITSESMPKHVYISSTASLNTSKLQQINPNHYGTRHQSMFSYCWNNPSSIGLVISQDGDVRVISRVASKLIIWENIRVQRFSASNKLSRKKIINK